MIAPHCCFNRTLHWPHCCNIVLGSISTLAVCVSWISVIVKCWKLGIACAADSVTASASARGWMLACLLHRGGWMVACLLHKWDTSSCQVWFIVAGLILVQALRRKSSASFTENAFKKQQQACWQRQFWHDGHRVWGEWCTVSLHIGLSSLVASTCCSMGLTCTLSLWVIYSGPHVVVGFLHSVKAHSGHAFCNFIFCPE